MRSIVRRRTAFLVNVIEMCVSHHLTIDHIDMIKYGEECCIRHKERQQTPTDIFLNVAYHACKVKEINPYYHIKRLLLSYLHVGILYFNKGKSPMIEGQSQEIPMVLWSCYAEPIRVLYSTGESPVLALNRREKYWGYSNPNE